MPKARTLDDNFERNEITANLFQFLSNNINWEWRNHNHRVAWYTDPEFSVQYGYGNSISQPQDFPGWMLEMREHMMKTLNLPTDDPPTGCNLNL